jgi:hypothetical protein
MKCYWLICTSPCLWVLVIYFMLIRIIKQYFSKLYSYMFIYLYLSIYSFIAFYILSTKIVISLKHSSKRDTLMEFSKFCISNEILIWTDYIKVKWWKEKPLEAVNQREEETVIKFMCVMCSKWQCLKILMWYFKIFSYTTKHPEKFKTSWSQLK